MAYETANLLHGRTRNPWTWSARRRDRAGRVGAIAAGMSAAGLGSDSGGSVRVPAHFTGICSLKPTPDAFRDKAPAAVRGPFSYWRNWANGADNGGCGSDVSYLSGQDATDPVSRRWRYARAVWTSCAATQLDSLRTTGWRR